MILCVGTTPTMQRTMTFDRLRLDDVNRAASVREYASGKSANVARVARALGHEALNVGFAGGERGRAFLRDLDRLGIRHDFATTEAATRLCTTVIDRGTGQVTELVEESGPVEAEAWRRLGEKIAAHRADARAWVFSGSLPPGAPVETYVEWVGMGVRQGAGVVLDARGEAVRRALPLGGFVLKLNRAELAATVEADLPTDAALHEALRRATPAGGAAIVTLGAAGALAWDGARLYRVTAPAVAAMNPIGSGDAFAAGLAAGMEAGEPFAEQLRLAAACGAANAMTPEAGLVEPESVRELLRKISVLAV